MSNKRFTLIIAAVSVVFAGGFALIYNGPSVLTRIIDGMSVAGLLNIAAAFACHVHNNGQFKLFSYSSYRKQALVSKKDEDPNGIPEDANVPSFADYAGKKPEKKWNPAPFYICGLPLLLTALIMIFISP
ncbi:MAG: DUF3899 domain-containing protein [Clostridiales bacterium]|nr:DUF3899 domain-containing protein [Clostridiales bacterium]